MASDSFESKIIMKRLRQTCSFINFTLKLRCCCSSLQSCRQCSRFPSCHTNRLENLAHYGSRIHAQRHCRSIPSHKLLVTCQSVLYHVNPSDKVVAPKSTKWIGRSSIASLRCLSGSRWIITRTRRGIWVETWSSSSKHWIVEIGMHPSISPTLWEAASWYEGASKGIMGSQTRRVEIIVANSERWATAGVDHASEWTIHVIFIIKIRNETIWACTRTRRYCLKTSSIYRPPRVGEFKK